MTLLQFAHSINYISSKSELYAALFTFINAQPTQKTNKDELKNFINAIAQNEFTQFGLNIGGCQSYCIDELSKESNKGDNDYNDKLKSAKSEIDLLSAVYQEITEERKIAQAQIEKPDNIEQQKIVLKDLALRTNELKEDLIKIDNKFENTNVNIDEKVFTLLINTVGILGIFVAIAFTGFGVGEIFPTINFAVALYSKEMFIKTLFLFLLVALVCYNLLLVLVYMIFKLSRPLFLSIKGELKSDTRRIRWLDIKTPEECRFVKLVNFTPFLWIDGILLACTIAAFLCSILIW